MSMSKFFKRGRFKISHNVEYQLRDKDGNVKPLLNRSFLGRLLNMDIGAYKDSLSICNLVTNAGFAGVSSRINGSGAEAVFTYIAIGIGAVAADVADVALGSEITTLG